MLHLTTYIEVNSTKASQIKLYRIVIVIRINQPNSSGVMDITFVSAVWEIANDYR